MYTFNSLLDIKMRKGNVVYLYNIYDVYKENAMYLSNIYDIYVITHECKGGGGAT